MRYLPRTLKLNDAHDNGARLYHIDGDVDQFNIRSFDMDYTHLSNMITIED